MTPVPVGAPAPDFSLRDQHGATFGLTESRGREPVVVVFFPFAFSGVCSGELRALRDGWAAAAPEGARLVAVSCDPMFALRAWSEAEGIGFPLLSDFWPHGETASAYGVLDEARGCPRRSTFVVGRDGSIGWSVHHEIGEPRDPSSYAEALRSLSL